MKDVLVTARIDMIELVVGHRNWPLGRLRLDLLNEVGSSPARLAKPDDDMPFSFARLSIAVQIA
jgi:hypothetical protein